MRWTANTTRLFLAWINAAAFIAGVVLLKQEIGRSYRIEWAPVLVACLALAVPLLNSLVLFRARIDNDDQPGRIRRMFRLWLDAKEADLRRRAGP